MGFEVVLRLVFEGVGHGAGWAKSPAIVTRYAARALCWAQGCQGTSMTVQHADRIGAGITRKRGDRQSAIGAVRNGKNDDGNVYVTAVQQGLRIRTGKSGEAAI